MHSVKENLIHPRTLDFDLPEELIAQEPTSERDRARLLVLEKKTGVLTHRSFFNLVDYVRAGDVLVLNKARVDPARIDGKKTTGGRVQVIFVGPTGPAGQWRALIRPFLKDGAVIELGQSRVKATVNGRTSGGEYLLQIDGMDPRELMEKEGRLPLPPYIKRDENDPRNKIDEALYQTVYAATPGSVAAPTAGLHFSEKLISELKTKGVSVVEILLHVGWGTFKPIADDLDSHRMLPERYEVTAAALKELKQAKREGRRIIAVGTTSTRVLESLPLDVDENFSGNLQGETELFIRPGFQFKWVSALITNLHVPRSTPISLTAAFAGFSELEKAYAEAIREKYRFFSYGDAMLVL